MSLKSFFPFPKVIHRENTPFLHEHLKQVQPTADSKVVGFGGKVDKSICCQQFVEGVM